ncbi:hypothetical protein F4780DRAFT_769124 [Xylariomycetidae sp. FL0641]|nr:hypothetical protein F4780DRAFT_769124 [Xylariomycetidae sp. FL0641]
MAGPGLLGILPDEILLHVISFVDTREIVNLQLVSKRLLRICRDGNLWRNRCLAASASLERIELYRSGSNWVDTSGHALGGAQATPGEGPGQDDRSDIHWSLVDMSRLGSRKREKEYARIAANWDPTFPGERTDWYDEYIQRNGPIAVSWFEQPHVHSGTVRDAVDVSGAALYRPSPESHEVFAVSPLEDGTVCMWDVKGTNTRRGAILAKSSPGILYPDGPSTDLSKRSKMINSGITECVSVDSQSSTAFFAVQSYLIQVDLNTLKVAGKQRFDWSINTMSEADPRVPLTIGTTNGLHLHDSRMTYQDRNEHPERTDQVDKLAQVFHKIWDPTPLPPFASLAQPGPQSILHLPIPGDKEQLSDDILVAGRFSNILHYDRRMFPAIKGSLHSGGRLCGLAALPYPFSSVDSDLRRKFQLSVDQVNRSKNAPGGRTVIACGEYNTKGSLELYGLSSESESKPDARVSSVMKNRQTASQSKLLSVINHGNRIVFSDGQGYLKWVERDGFTEVRRHKIGKSEKVAQRSLFGSMSGSDEIARKIMSTRTGNESSWQINDDGILFWTGEKLGLLEISSKAGFSAEDFEDHTRTPEEIAADDEALAYREKLRRVLEYQASEAAIVRNLGAGSIHNGV